MDPRLHGDDNKDDGDNYKTGKNVISAKAEIQI